MKNQWIYRIVGGWWLLTSLLWLALSVAALLWGWRWLDQTSANLENNLARLHDDLGIIQNVLLETTDVITATAETLTTIQGTTYDLTLTVIELRPLIDQTSLVVTQQVPNALDGVQMAMPTLIETAAAVDSTLRLLSAVNLTVPNPLGDDWRLDLGVDYQPTVPLDQAIADLSSQLDGLPAELRAMEAGLAATDENLLLLSEDLGMFYDDLGQIHNQLVEISPGMLALAASLAELQTSLVDGQAGVPTAFASIKGWFAAIVVLIGLSQAPLAFMGCWLAQGRWSGVQLEQEKP